MRDFDFYKVHEFMYDEKMYARDSPLDFRKSVNFLLRNTKLALRKVIFVSEISDAHVNSYHHNYFNIDNFHGLAIYGLFCILRHWRV